MAIELSLARLRYGEYVDWYEGRLDSLFRIAATQVNGLALVPGNEVTTRLNYFNAYSRFYSDAMLNDLPELEPEATSLLVDLVKSWAITGEAVLIRTGGQLRSLRPQYLHPVRDAADADTILYYRLVFPLGNNYSGREPRLNLSATQEGRARVIEFVPGVGAIETERSLLGTELGDDPGGGVPVDLTELYWIDTGDGIYDYIEGIVREVNIRTSILQSALNASAYPILELALDSVADGAFALKAPTAARVGALAKQGLGLIAQPPFTGEAQARYVERSGTGLVEAMDYIRLLLGQLAIMSGVPDYVYGVNLNQTPGETERVLFSGQAKVNRLRRQLERVLPQVGIDIHFATEPFTTRSSRAANIRTLLEAGIISANEAREALGYANAD